MSAWDDYYDDLWEKEHLLKEKNYNDIIKRFENLSLEEKVDLLIKIYARKEAYN